MKRFIAALAVLGLLCLTSWSQETGQPKHLVEAKQLLKQVSLSNTSYKHGTSEIVWQGTCSVHADCSGFMDGLLSHTYGYDEATFKKWFDSRRPTAARYHDAIVQGNGFTEVKTVGNVRPGDIIAVKYLHRKDNTGHVMLVAELPQRMKAKKPIMEGTEQWEITVIDSSQSGHGSTDTRHHQGKDGKDHDGLGQGVLRLYTDKQGHIAGFAWSTLGASKFAEPTEEHVVIGRLAK